MPRLEHIVSVELPAAAAATHDPATRLNPSFRLWLTSAPAQHFPPAVLQAGTKVALEPPRGVRAQALRGLSALPAGYLSSCDAAGRGAEWRCLLASGVLLHAVVRERRRYGALGWSAPYEFSDGDLSCSLSTLQMFLTEGAAAVSPGRRARGRGGGFYHPLRSPMTTTTAAATAAAAAGLRRDDFSNSVPSSPSSTAGGGAGFGALLTGSSASAHSWVPWAGLTFVTGDIIYGGRVTDDNDRRLLGALVRRHYCPEVLGADAAMAGEGARSVWVD
jgi:hypothetical protein